MSAPGSRSTEPELDELYRTMTRIRSFEQRVGRHFRDGDVHGFVHVSIGQEAVAAGACSVLGAHDAITTTHRGHGHCIARGADVTAMLAELFGRATGICGGFGGSMHIADPDRGIMGANGIVGAGIPLAAGVALAAQLAEQSGVSVGFFGEGAVHSGAFHEGATLAVAWRLPLLLVCENNGYAEFTASDRWAGPTLTERAGSYGMTTAVVDGSDVLAVRDAVAGAVGRLRAGDGPAFIEAQTHRFGGHFEGDAEEYRDAGETERVRRERDPLLIARRTLGSERCDALDAEAERELDDAVAVALDAPYPDAVSFERALADA